jgi:hypothetical protein
MDAASVVAAVDVFRSDPRFEAATNAEITYAADILFYLRDFRQRTQDILARLEASESPSGPRSVPPAGGLPPVDRSAPSPDPSPASC